MVDRTGELPPWEELYKKSPAESLPWYNTELDGDLKSALDKLPLNKGTVLDPGYKARYAGDASCP